MVAQAFSKLAICRLIDQSAAISRSGSRRSTCLSVQQQVIHCLDVFREQAHDVLHFVCAFDAEGHRPPWFHGQRAKR